MWVMHLQLRKWYRIKEGTSLEINQWYGKSLKIQHEYRAQKKFFVAKVDSILLYGCEAWTLNKAMEKVFNDTFTRMSRRAFNIHWSDRVTNNTVYSKPPKVSDKIAGRRLRLAGHCKRKPELGAHHLILYGKFPMVNQAGADRGQLTLISKRSIPGQPLLES